MPYLFFADQGCDKFVWKKFKRAFYAPPERRITWSIPSSTQQGNGVIALSNNTYDCGCIYNARQPEGKTALGML